MMRNADFQNRLDALRDASVQAAERLRKIAHAFGPSNTGTLSLREPAVEEVLIEKERTRLRDFIERVEADYDKLRAHLHATRECPVCFGMAVGCEECAGRGRIAKDTEVEDDTE